MEPLWYFNCHEDLCICITWNFSNQLFGKKSKQAKIVLFFNTYLASFLALNSLPLNVHKELCKVWWEITYAIYLYRSVKNKHNHCQFLFTCHLHSLCLTAFQTVSVLPDCSGSQDGNCSGDSPANLQWTWTMREQ